MNNTPMKPEEAMQIANSFARLQQLKNATIKQVADDAEIKGLVEFLAHSMLEHANEFLGCYFVMHNEYEPFIEGFLPVFRRVLATLQRHNQQAQAEQVGAKIDNTLPAQENKIIGLDGNPTAQ